MPRHATIEALASDAADATLTSSCLSSKILHDDRDLFLPVSLVWPQSISTDSSASDNASTKSLSAADRSSQAVLL